ncbi:uncharacterized mitochondrial protein-like protein, partial [Tanacetum coccineum]
SKEVIDIDVQTEDDADLMVVSSTSLTEATRKVAVSEKIATKKTHSPKQPSSTSISKSADDIMTFRKELDALALKHLGPVPATKALYGLHQALRAWYATLSTFLVKHGYRRGTIDKTLFIRRNKKDIMLVQVYVDDIIF